MQAHEDKLDTINGTVVTLSSWKLKTEGALGILKVAFFSLAAPVILIILVEVMDRVEFGG